MCRVKGKEFTISNLLGDDMFNPISDDPKCALAIARLAPQDYHRFHSPVDGVVSGVKDIHGKSLRSCP